nr:MAG TPA: hypothetical protein [Crassvirales sp.]
MQIITPIITIIVPIILYNAEPPLLSFYFFFIFHILIVKQFLYFICYVISFCLQHSKHFWIIFFVYIFANFCHIERKNSIVRAKIHNLVFAALFLSKKLRRIAIFR